MSHARRHVEQAVIVWVMWGLTGVMFYVTAKLHIFPLEASIALKTLGTGMMLLGIPGLIAGVVWVLYGRLLDVPGRR